MSNFVRLVVDKIIDAIEFLQPEEYKVHYYSHPETIKEIKSLIRKRVRSEFPKLKFRISLEPITRELLVNKYPLWERRHYDKVSKLSGCLGKVAYDIPGSPYDKHSCPFTTFRSRSLNDEIEILISTIRWDLEEYGK